MPELPDITLYLERLEPRIVGRELVDVRLQSPFLLRTVEPPLSHFIGRAVVGLKHIGKRIVWEFPDEHYLVVHLMIAGRLRWREAGAALPGRSAQAAFDFAAGSLLLTEAGSKRRASLALVQGRAALAEIDRGGLDVFAIDQAAFAERMRLENHTLKRALTDPRLFSGIGNAYSDEILFAARLSPLTWTSRLADDELERLFDVTRAVLENWTERLRAELGPDAFPEKVTAFRPEMAVHGRFGEPCPDCAGPVQRIRYAKNETNYCPGCQTGGKLLADRGISRLLKGDWPRSLAELEERRERLREDPPESS